MRSKLIICCLVVAALAGCSGPLVAKPEPDHTITYASLPSDPDPQESKRVARTFVKEGAGGGSFGELGDTIERVFGDWDKGGNRAFIATSLSGTEATTESGRRIAEAFAHWHTGEVSAGRVRVYDGNGDLLYRGRF